MEYEHQFLTKILSRSSSVGCSSRIPYYRNPEGVPFKWEMQPGTPKDPPKQEVLPPISPPPAILSLGLPKPCIEHHKPSTRPRLQFWKKRSSMKNKQISKKLQQGSDHQKCPIDPNVDGLDIFAGLEFCSSDCEFIASPPRNSVSSSSSSFSFTNGPSVRSSSSESPGRDDMYKKWPLSCSPWNITRRVWYYNMN